jgi:ABC-type uncharacterized transport system ATPase subunit
MARQLGVAMVFQHFSLFDTLTVTENIALGLHGDTDMRNWQSKSARLVKPTGWSWNHSGMFIPYRSVNVSAWKLCAPC